MNKLIQLEKACIAERTKYLYEEEIPFSSFRTPQLSRKILVDDSTVVANQDKLSFTLNCALTKMKYKNNEYIKSIVFDTVMENANFSFKVKKPIKLCIWISQFLPLTKTGIIRNDVDNADIKGIIDGVAQALYIDDNGLNISLHSEILPLPNGEKPYTRITIVRDELIREIINQM